MFFLYYFSHNKVIDMDNSGRFINEKKTIDDEAVHSFFDNRINKSLYHRYNLVNYQDNNPKLALERDKEEKALILPYLNVRSDSNVLDIGCGVGRWGDELSLKLNNGIYVGVDYSEKLIDIAIDHFSKCPEHNTRFCVGSFQDLPTVLKNNDLYMKYDTIIITGVFMYINDSDITQCLQSLGDISADGCRIYIKESVGVENRYTLVDIYSSELTSNYNAIYRSVYEYNELFSTHLKHNNPVSQGETFSKGDLHNRKETTSYYWVFE